MEEIIKKIAQLESKVKKLILINKQLLAEKDILQKQNTESQQIIIEQKKELKNLEEKNNFLKIAKSLTINEEERNELKINIEDMEKEIDKCIALLKN